MTEPSTYTPPKVWTWDKENGGRFANINRPIAGPTHDKELPVGRHPLQLYSLATPNGQKVTIMLEELLALGHKGADQGPALLEIQLVGQGQQQLAGRDGVLAGFAFLGRIPQRLAVAEPRRRRLRRQDLRELDALLPGEVEVHRKPLVGERHARAIGGGRHRGPARGPLDGLNLAQERRHASSLSFAASAVLGSLRAKPLAHPTRRS